MTTRRFSSFVVALLSLAILSACDKGVNPVAPTGPVAGPSPSVSVTGTWRGTATLRSCTSNIDPDGHHPEWHGLPWPCGGFGVLGVGGSMEVVINVRGNGRGSFNYSWQDPNGGVHNENDPGLNWVFESEMIDLWTEGVESYFREFAITTRMQGQDLPVVVGDNPVMMGTFQIERFRTQQETSLEVWDFEGHHQ